MKRKTCQKKRFLRLEAAMEREFEKGNVPKATDLIHAGFRVNDWTDFCRWYERRKLKRDHKA